jgi:uncharacterized Zn finger protein (UPF0148 family)
MATMQCPACGLTVPYFCCEGLVCPACGYDEEQDILSGLHEARRDSLQVASQPPLAADARAPRPPTQ